MTTTAESAESVDNELVVRGLVEFVQKVVLPAEDELGHTLHDPRRRYGEDGREVATVVDARRSVRMASAQAGYYAMFTPSDVGGGGLGATLYFLCYEALQHHFGAGHPLLDNVLAHWA